MLDVVRALGALAGLAAVAGLGVLSVLYHLHARDVKRLRAWAGGAPERSSPAPSPKHRPDGARRRMPARDVGLVLACLVVLAGVGVLGVAALTGDDGGEDPAERASSHGRTGAAVDPDTVTVAVLNGTMVPGLAAGLSDQLAAARFRPGRIDDYPDKQLAESVVQYAAGHEADARAVARRLGISRVGPVTAEGGALAGDATVIVVAGADTAP